MPAKSDTTEDAFTAEEVSTIAINLNRKQRDGLKWITDDEASDCVSPAAVEWCIKNGLAVQVGKRGVVEPTDLGREVRKLID
jgi:hypothetical protein